MMHCFVHRAENKNDWGRKVEGETRECFVVYFPVTLSSIACLFIIIPRLRQWRESFFYWRWQITICKQLLHFPLSMSTVRARTSADKNSQTRKKAGNCSDACHRVAPIFVHLAAIKLEQIKLKTIILNSKHYTRLHRFGLLLFSHFSFSVLIDLVKCSCFTVDKHPQLLLSYYSQLEIMAVDVAIWRNKAPLSNNLLQSHTLHSHNHTIRH